MKERIFDGALRVIRKKGLKFTMDELAYELSMSKKTIYKCFKDKKDMLYELIDYVFDKVKAGEERVVSDESLTTDEKLRRILTVLPDEFNGMDLSMMYVFAEKYPKHYKRIVNRLEGGWELTWQILEEGIKEGVFRPVRREVFKLMYEAALERILFADDMKRYGLSYVEALDMIVEILMEGIRK